MIAVSNTVKDIDANEEFNSSNILKELKQADDTSGKTKAENTNQIHSQPGQKQTEKISVKKFGLSTAIDQETHSHPDDIPSEQPLPQKESVDIPVIPEATPSLPDLNGKTVIFIPDDSSLSKTTGYFSIKDDNEYKGEYKGSLINIKTTNEKKKAKSYNGKIPAVVVGKPQSGKYSLKMC